MDPALIVFDANQRNAIVNAHNRWRDDAAAGRIVGFQGQALPPATRMAKMQWSNELAQLAELNAKQCVMRHDSCRGTTQFNYAGQNLGIYFSSEPFDNLLDVAIELVDEWAKEHVFARVSDINSLQSTVGGDGGVIGHFTAVVNEKMTHVGCAMVTFIDDGWNTALLACNYAFTNFIGRRVYQAGVPTIDCTTGRDSTFPNLCTVNENINVNDPNRMADQLETPALYHYDSK